MRQHITLLAALLTATACASAPEPAPQHATIHHTSPHHHAPALTARIKSGPWDPRIKLPLDDAALKQRLDTARVIIIAESHDDAWHHLLQLHLYTSLDHSSAPVALGMEMFQRPFQPALDAYISGAHDERAMLQQTEYSSRWGYSPILYAPLWRAARSLNAPLLALNTPRELSRRIAQVGLDGLTPDERAQLPAELHLTDQAHRDWFKKPFEAHGGDISQDPQTFERFYQAQVAWDETMADTAAAYLNQDPNRRLVILAGSGHILHDHGIPSRLARRLGSRDAILTILPISRHQHASPTHLDAWHQTHTADLIWVE